MTRSEYCGRIDPHDAHEWLGRDHDAALPSIPRDCPGAPVIEGGHFGVSSCDECGYDVRDNQAAPSCGAHRLHQECAEWFSCRECDYVRSEVPC